MSPLTHDIARGAPAERGRHTCLPTREALTLTRTLTRTLTLTLTLAPTLPLARHTGLLRGRDLPTREITRRLARGRRAKLSHLLPGTPYTPYALTAPYNYHIFYQARPSQPLTACLEPHSPVQPGMHTAPFSLYSPSHPLTAPYIFCQILAGAAAVQRRELGLEQSGTLRYL